MNGYDFDKTIYDGDSFIHFYFFCLLKFPYLALLLPVQLFFMLCTFYSRKYVKQSLAIYLLFVPNKEKQIDLFWKKNKHKIKQWYLDQQEDNDIIISASPVFLLAPICKELGIQHLIATQMDIRNGVITGRNCQGKEKVVAFRQVMGNETLETFYSDSKSDIPMMDISLQGYFVFGNKIVEREELPSIK